MPCTATQTTYDVCAVYTLLGTFPTTMALVATVLTELVLVVTEGTVQHGEFTELATLVVILTFGRGCGLCVSNLIDLQNK